jgi:hypothetical protein
MNVESDTHPEGGRRNPRNPLNVLEKKKCGASLE